MIKFFKRNFSEELVRELTEKFPNLTLLVEKYDKCIIGISEDTRIIYSYNKVIQIYEENKEEVEINKDYEDAEESNTKDFSVEETSFTNKLTIGNNLYLPYFVNENFLHKDFNLMDENTLVVYREPYEYNQDGTLITQ